MADPAIPVPGSRRDTRFMQPLSGANRPGDVFFDHDRLEVYQVARAFNREVRQILSGVSTGQSESKNNLRRSAKSVTRNIAEGCGQWRIRDKVNFYHIARASATESAASLDELVDFGLLPEARILEARQLLARVVAMLIAMIRSLEARDRPDMGG